MDNQNFDSIVCLGTVDWWYHNRGHFDLQILSRIANDIPVLYVNSIGMRLPKPGRGGFFTKIINKLRSFKHGLTKVENNFWVFSPVSFPGFSSGLPASLCLLRWQLQIAMKRSGLRNPLYWVGPPSGLPLIKSLPKRPLLYQCTDLYECYPGVDRKLISKLDQQLRQSADITVFCSSFLYDKFRQSCKSSILIDHGVDYDNFLAGDKSQEPHDLCDIPRPRVGFIGSINKGVFDPDFFLEVVKLAPQIQFVMVGNCSMPEGWCPFNNVHFLGKKPLSEVPAYMGACDVLSMYWCRNEWIKACNPVKTKEYLAVGRPTVSTPFYELKNYTGLVKEAATPENFVQAIQSSKEWFTGAEIAREKIQDITWDAQANKLLKGIQNLLGDKQNTV